jgi:hypothetical protein
LTASDHSVRSTARRAAIAALGERLLLIVLFAAILGSPFVFMEPSPYEALMGVLALTCLLAGVTVPRAILPLVFLLLVWNCAGAMSLLNAAEDTKAITFIAISFYLAITAILFACLFAHNSVQRLSVMRRAYILAAFIAASIGIAAYFGVIPGSETFTMGGRAKSTFKDPNVYGPFLILPLLFLVETILVRGLRLRHLIAALVIIFGLFLSFSRGAWMHTVVSAAVTVALLFVTTPSTRLRGRIVLLTIVAVVAVAAMLAIALSFDSIGGLFKERANLVNYYDAGESGRFGNQIRSLTLLLEMPNGFGPLQFGQVYFPQDPHNVYLNAFASYGWLGGIAYVLMVLATLMVGLRAALVATPWQAFLIPIYGTFVGEVLEGFIVDTDHWRHFFLLLGAIWGLAAATERAKARARHRRAGLSPSTIRASGLPASTVAG